MIRTLFAPFLATLLFALPMVAQANPPTPESGGKKVSLQFSGKLRDGLRQLASKGGINLIITGELDQPAELHLTNTSAEEALSSVAEAYQLKVHRQGSIWTLRPMTEAEKSAASSASGSTEDPDEPDSAAPEPKPVPEPAEAPAPPQVGKAPLPPPLPKLPDLPVPPEKLARRIEEALLKKSRDRKESDRFGTGDVTVAAGETVETAVAYGGDMVVGAGAVVEDDAVAFGGDLTIESGAVVEGDAVAFGGDVLVKAGAVVEGAATSFGGKVVKEPGAVVEGGRSELSMDRAGQALASPEASKRGVKLNPKRGFPGFFLSFAILFGLGFLSMMFVPNRVQLLQEEVRKNPVMCALTGGLGAFLIAIIGAIFLFLCIVLVGIPLSIALWVLVSAALVLGVTAVANELGTRVPLFKRRKSQAIILALGVAGILLLSMIPVLGVLVSLVVLFLGLGAAIRTRMGQRAKTLPIVDRIVTDSGAPVA